MFDACRNELHLSSTSAKAIAADKGFVPVAEKPGLLIAYATAPGRTASDAGEGGGVYAKTLAEEISEAGRRGGVHVPQRADPANRSIGQDPWLSFPSLAPVYFAGGEATPSALSKAAQAWEDIKSRTAQMPGGAGAVQPGASRLEAGQMFSPGTEPAIQSHI